MKKKCVAQAEQQSRLWMRLDRLIFHLSTTQVASLPPPNFLPRITSQRLVSNLTATSRTIFPNTWVKVKKQEDLSSFIDIFQ